MKKQFKLITLIASLSMTIVLLFSNLSLAFYSEYAGSITNDLLAPTSIHVSDDQIAVLEPFKKQLTVFSSSGVNANFIDFEGDAVGLTRLSANIYLFCDTERNTIASVDINRGEQLSYFSDDTFVKPTDILMNGNIIYILDAGSNEIVKASANGSIIDRIPISSTNVSFGYASSFVMNHLGDRFYVLDQTESIIKVFALDGRIIFEFSAFGHADGEITRGGELACDNFGNIYVSDRFQGRIAVFDHEGDFITNLVLADYSIAGFSMPSGIGFDSDGFLYISTTETAKIHIIFIDPQGSPNRVLSATQAYPEEAASVDLDNIYMLAYVDENPENNLITGFDFQLFNADNQYEPWAEVSDAVPIIEQEGGALYSEWHPEAEFIDNSRYTWRVRVKSEEFTGEWSVKREFNVTSLPKKFSLEQNYPNPFNPVTRIAFELPRESEAILTVYNSLGQQVSTFSYENLPAGRHEIIWNGKDSSGNTVSSGIYFYRLKAGDFDKTKKMVLLK